MLIFHKWVFYRRKDLKESVLGLLKQLLWALDGIVHQSVNESMKTRSKVTQVEHPPC